MPGYHSKFVEESNQCQVIGRIPLLPIKTTYRGPAPPCQPGVEDIIDETLTFFKANIFFRNFDVESNADRLLIYLTLYTAQCLNVCVRKSKGGAKQALYTMALQNFPIPGDNGFVLGGFCTAPGNRQETDLIRQYLTQCRQEIGDRLVERVYATNETLPDKWWICFAKRKFLNMSLE